MSAPKPYRLDADGAFEMHRGHSKTSLGTLKDLRNTPAARRDAAPWPKTRPALITLVVIVCACCLFGYIDPEGRIGGPAGPEKRWFLVELLYRMCLCGMLFQATFYVSRGDRSTRAVALSGLFSLMFLAGAMLAYWFGLVWKVASVNEATAMLLAGPVGWISSVTEMSGTVQYFKTRSSADVGGPGFTLFAWGIEATYFAVSIGMGWLLSYEFLRNERTARGVAR